MNRGFFLQVLIFGVISISTYLVSGTSVLAVYYSPSVLNPTVFSYENSTPKVDGASGALTQSVSLDLPPGRNGMQPNLFLNYNSQNTDQDSLVGQGWNMPIPYIQRLNKTGSQDLYGPNAYFTSSFDGELVAAPAVSTTSVPANPNSASFTQSTDTYAVSSSNLGITNGSITMEFWINMTTIPTGTAFPTAYSCWIEKDDAGTHVGYSMYYFHDAGGYHVDFLRQGGSTLFARWTSATAPLAANTWYHMAGVYDGSNLTIYMAPQNGTHTQEVQTAAVGTNGTTGYPNALSIGDTNLGNSTPFTPNGCATQGQIDDVRIYNTARSQAQLDSDFQSQVAPPVSNLVAYYQLNNSWNDSTANGYNLTATNSPTFSTNVPFTGSAVSSGPSTISLGGTAYAKVDDGSTRRYQYSTTTNSWTMYDKSGTQYIFGSSTQSQQYATSSPSNVYKWMLEKQIDTNGNYVRYVYAKDQNQIYPYQILYTGRGGADGPLTVTFATTTRPDSNISLKAGFEVDTNWRIATITAAVSGNTVRQYSLSYTTGSNGKRSLLSAVQQNGWDDSGVKTTLPAVTFGYATTSASFLSQNQPGSGQLCGDPWVAADTTGNGKNDSVLFYVNANDSTRNFYLYPGGTGTMQFGATTIPYWGSVVHSLYVTTCLVDSGTRVASVTGNGKADIIQGTYNTVTGTSTSAVYLNYSSPSSYVWTASTTTGVIPNFQIVGASSAYTTGLMTDVNADGLPDFVYSVPVGFTGAGTQTYFGNGSSWSSPTTTIFSAPGTFTASGSDCNNYQLVDINGDGLPDWVYASGNNTYVKLNTGTTWQSSPDSRWTIGTSTVYTSAGSCYDRGMRFVDINGDGLPDFIRSYTAPAGNGGGLPEIGTYQFAFLNTGSGWATSTAYSIPYIIQGFVVGGGNSNTSYTELANFQGNGQQYQDVLATTTNLKGGSTTATYGLTAQSGTNPRMPYSLLTVTKLVNHNGSGSNEETSYSYAGGQQYLPANVIDRKFAGFAVSTTTNSDGITVSYYSQGATSTALVPGDISDGYSQLNRPYRQDIFTPSGAPVQKTFYRWDTYLLGTSTNQSTFIGLGRQLVQDYASGGSHVDKATDYTYSTTTGNLIKTQNYGQVTGNTDGTFSTTSASNLRTTLISYAASSSINLFAPIEKTLFNNSNATTTYAQYLYDSLPFGQVALGNQTKQLDLISTSTLTYASTTKTYNLFGLVASSSDRKGNITSYVYDPFNLYLATTSNPLLQTTQYIFNYANGKTTQTINSNGGVVKNTYDGIGRLSLVQQTNPQSTSTLDTVKVLQYQDNTTIPSMTREVNYFNAATSTDSYSYYDGLSRIVQERKSSGVAGVFNVSDSTYGTDGLLATQSLPYAPSGASSTVATSTSYLYTTYTYDPLGRKLSIANVLRNTVNAYNGWTTTVTDAIGHVKDTTVDAFGNLAQVVEHGNTNATTLYTYDAANNLTNITDAQGNVRNFTFDALGNRLMAQDLHASAAVAFGSTTYAYDVNGNLVSQTDAKNQTITHTYDALNRMLTEGWTGQGTQVTNTYDSCGSGIGKMCTASSSAAKYTYAYDVLGRTTQATTTLNGTNYGLGYTYDRLGNVASTTNSDGTLVTYVYNSAGLISAVNRKIGGVNSLVATLSNYSPTNKVGQIVFGSGASTTYTYNPAQLYRLTRILTLGAFASSSSTTTQSQALQDLNYAYDAVGNITTRTDNSYSGNGQGVTYLYDNLNRLLSASTAVSTINAYQQSYTYDALGNMTSLMAGVATSTPNPTSASFTQSTDTYAVASTTLGVTNGNITMEFWINMSTIPTGTAFPAAYSCWIEKDDASTHTGYSMYYFHDAGGYHVDLLRQKGGGATQFARWNSVTPQLVANTWYHIAGVYDGSNVTLYMAPANGTHTQQAQAAASGDGVSGYASAFAIGDTGFGNTSPFTPGGCATQGLIDDVRVYNTARTPAQLDSDFQSQVAPPVTNLVAYYQLNNSWNDSTANGYNLTATNTPSFSTNVPFAGGGLGSGINAPTTVYSYAGTGFANPDATTKTAYTVGASSPTITYDNSTVGGGGVPASSLTFTHTTNYNTNGIILVSINESATTTCATDKVTGVTYNGVALTDAGYYVGNYGAVAGALKTYYGFAPATGANNVVVSASASCILYATAATYTGVKQSGFPDASGTGNPLSNSGAVRLFQATTTTATNNAWAILVGVPSNSTTTTQGSNTFLRQQQPGHLYLADSGGPISPQGAIGLSLLTPTTTNWIANYFALTPANANPGTTTNTLYSYDANGNVTSVGSPLGTTTYTYDYANRLTQSVVNGSVTTYAYDPFGQRIMQRTASSTTWYPNKYTTVTTATSSTLGTTTSYVFMGDTLLQTVDQPTVSGVATGTSTLRYIHVDNLNSTNVTSDTIQKLAQWFSYLPYGSVLTSTSTGSTTVARQYIGQYTDTSGLSYLNARYYDGGRGQFLSQDPLFLGDPKQQNLKNPQSLNSYAYANGNPIVNSDPDGKFIPFILAAIGYGLTAAGVIDFGFSAYDVYQTNVQYPQVFTSQQKSDSRFNLYVSGASLAIPDVAKSYNLVKGEKGKIALDAILTGTTKVGEYIQPLAPNPNVSKNDFLQTYSNQSNVNRNDFLNQYAASQIRIPTTPYSPYGQTISAPALPSSVSQNGVTYYRNSFGTLSTTPGQ